MPTPITFTCNICTNESLFQPEHYFSTRSFLLVVRAAQMFDFAGWSIVSLNSSGVVFLFPSSPPINRLWA